MKWGKTADELLRGATAMTAWGTGAVAALTAASSSTIGPPAGLVLILTGAACAAMTLAAFGRAARAARAWAD